MGAVSSLWSTHGASVVALTAGDAARLGIGPPPGAFTADVKTAKAWCAPRAA